MTTPDNPPSADPLSDTRAREIALREVLEVISRSRDDEAPVFDIILESAARLCKAPHAFLMLRNEHDTHLEIVAESLAEISSFEDLKAYPYALDDHGSLTIETLHSAKVRHIPDLQAHDISLNPTPKVALWIEKEGIRTLLYVPLLKDGRALGLIGVYKHEVAPFDGGEIEMVQTFAAQAVIAIENVRQFRELQTRLEREKALREILHVISISRSDEMPVLEVIVRNAARLCDATLAGLSLVNETRTQLHYTCIWGDDRGVFRIGYGFDLNGPLQVATSVREQRIIHTPDLMDDPLYDAGDPDRLKVVEKAGVRTFLTVPLISDGVAIGCLNLNRFEVKPFDDADIALIETFAAQAVIAIENVRQFRELQTRLEREAASREILQVISESRTDPAPVFEVILRNAAHLSGAPLANLLLLNDARSHWHLVAHFGDGLRHLSIGQTTPMDSDLVPAVAMRTAQVAQIEDLTDTDRYRLGDPASVAMVDVEGMRTIVCVPLLRGAEAIGCITLFRREVKAFTGDEITLVETFAAQAVIAIENVRQFRELQTRLEREEASREILQVISRSRTDTAPVFDVILRNAARLCGAPLAGLNIINEKRSHLIFSAHWGEPLQHMEVGVTSWPLDGELALARAVRECRVIHVTDLSDDELYRQRDPDRVAAVDGEGVRTFLAVPLVRQGEAIGCMGLYKREVSPFLDDEIELIKAFAAQAVIAIENVRQFRELQTRLEREAATSEVLSIISQSRDDEMPVFRMIQEHAARLCHAPFSGLFMVDESGKSLNLVLHTGSVPAYSDGGLHDWPLSGNSVMARAVVKKAVIAIDNMSETPAYRDGDPSTLRAVDVEGIQSFLAVPLLNDGQSIGCIGLYRTEPLPFNNDQVELVKTFAAQAVIAINNIKQFKALETLNAELGDRVDEQVGEIERVGRLKRFLPSAVADTVMSTGSEEMLKSHRAMIAILFCDIRGFTAFCESAEPEETIEVLQTFHETLGRLIHDAGAGFDHRAGDGIMVVFNDPVPCDDPAAAALRVAVQMRECMVEICTKWRKLGHRMGFGVGISLGYATVGMVGFEGRYDYTANGTVVNLASRLCDQAADQEILLSQRAATALEDFAKVESAGELTLKGFHAPVDVFRVIELKGTQ